VRLFARVNPEILMNDVPHCKFIIIQLRILREELCSEVNIRFGLFRDRAAHPFILKTDRTTIICPVMPLNGERAFEIMQREGVDTLVASSTENVYYVSNYWSLGKRLGCGVQAYAVLPIEAVPAIVAPLDEADLVLDSQTWIEDIRFHGSSKVEVGQPEEPSEQTELLLKLHKGARSETDGVSALLKTIEEKGLADGVIALDASGLTPSLYEQIKSKLSGAKLVDGASLLGEIRLVKTESELGRIKRATAITEKSMEDALEIARSEITELDLAGMYAYSVAYDGGQVTQNLIGFRERSAFPNPVPSLFEAERRDLVRMIFGCTWDHYHSNISRTAVIGRPLQKMQRRWEAVMSAQGTTRGSCWMGWW